MFVNSNSCFITFPLGFYQDKVGVGTPSALQVNFTVCPIQAWEITGVTVSTVAASVKYNDSSDLEANKETSVAEIKYIVFLMQI